MRYISTNNSKHNVDLKTAVLAGMPMEGGLYMPENLARLDAAFFKGLSGLSFQEVALSLASPFLSEDVPAGELVDIVENSMNFDIKLKRIDTYLSVLETFHGPTMAFKDFGARFMAQLMAYLIRGEDRELCILVATSGDTGSAVASGFLGVPGIRVVILYPSGKVSPSQEKQLTTQGGNITALEVEGSFDDCQRMVKSAFADDDLRSKMNISSANSINIARLLPQSFYYAWATGQLIDFEQDKVFSVPCGNFGNLTAGLMAKRMGIPIKHFIAATNSNAVFPKYLSTGQFKAKPSQHTMSNAMDVGNPSNLARINYLYGDDVGNIQHDVSSWSFNDKVSRSMIAAMFSEYNYTVDPHTAVGLLGMRAYHQQIAAETMQGVVVATAHPAKFPEHVEPIIGRSIEIPEQLQQYLNREKHSIQMSTSYEEFREYLLDN